MKATYSKGSYLFSPSERDTTRDTPRSGKLQSDFSHQAERAMSNCVGRDTGDFHFPSLAVPIVSADVGQHMSLRDWMKGEKRGEGKMRTLV